MSYQFTISDIGLRLIKAYEGFWPEARPLASGGYVVGFGHRLEEGEDEVVTEEEAEELLKADLAPVEDFINSRVHASMTQSQFDALCSLVFSIGEDAFLASDMLHNLNRGMVIEASNGFDNWLKGNIGGQVYVVDALVRRRTAEKALFLRPTQRVARAPRFELASIRAHELVEVSQTPKEDKEAVIHTPEPAAVNIENDLEAPIIVEAEPAAIVDTPEIEIPEEDPILIKDTEKEPHDESIVRVPVLLKEEETEKNLASSHGEPATLVTPILIDTPVDEAVEVESVKHESEKILIEDDEKSGERSDTESDEEAAVNPHIQAAEPHEEKDEPTSVQTLATPLAPVIYSDDVIEDDALTVSNVTPLTIVESVDVEEEDETSLAQEEQAPPILTVVENEPLEDADLGLPEDLIEVSMDEARQDIDEKAETVIEAVKTKAEDIEEKLSLAVDNVDEKVDNMAADAGAFIAPKVGLDPVEDVDQDEAELAVETESDADAQTSPIAAAAAEVSERLDALIEDKPSKTMAPDQIQVSTLDVPSNTKQDIIIDELQQDDALREQIARESQYNTNRYDDYLEVEDEGGRRGILAFGIMILVGLVSAIVGLVVNLQGSVRLLGENGPFISIAAMLIGGLLVVVGLLYMMKAIFTRD